jgi:hypothetical protein
VLEVWTRLQTRDIDLGMVCISGREGLRKARTKNQSPKARSFLVPLGLCLDGL